MTTSTSTSTPRSAVTGDWRHRAACLGEDPELFQPVTDAGAAYETQVAAAKAVCGRCPVRPECLTFALAMLPHGIAGGLTEQERHQERTRSRPSVRKCRIRPPHAGSPVEVAAAGRAAIRAGADVGEVARRFRVSKRTATRWAAQVRAETVSARTEEGSHGGNRAPLGTSQQCNPQAGTRTTEGPRS